MTTVSEQARHVVELHCPESDREHILDMLGLIPATPPSAAGEPADCYVPAQQASHGTPYWARKHRERGEPVCDSCRQAERSYKAGRRRARGIQPRSCGPIKHGTLGGASTHRKRGERACAECREAERVYTNLRRHGVAAS